MKRYWRQVTVEGLNLEKLIHQAGEAGMILKRIRRKGRMLHALVREDELQALNSLSQAGGWRIQSGKRIGSGRMWDSVRRRLLLLGGCTVVCVWMILFSMLMWRIDISNGGIYEQDIRMYLHEQGVRPFCRKKTVDTAKLRDDLEWRYPRVAWFEVGWRGSTLVIRVVEGVMPGENLSTEGSCDVIACRGGVVDSVVTVAGTPQVRRGEVVKKGQVLIAGVERTAEGGERQVAARGIVKARVWDAASVAFSVLERQTIYTGRLFETLEIATPWFPLWQADASGYEQEDVSVRTQKLGGLFLPLEIRRRTHMEAHVSIVLRDPETVKAEAGVAALRKLRQKTGVDDDFVDKWVDYSMIDSEQVCAVAYAERVVDIACSSRRQAE